MSKDTVGKIIQDLTKNSYQQSPWQIKKFAAKLKQIVSILTGIPVPDLELQEVKDRVLGEEWSTFVGLNEVIKTGTGRRPYTVREVLQRVGTEAMRDQIHQNVWVNALFADYFRNGAYPVTEFPKWLITDVRFPNEAQAIKERGGIVIRVERSWYDRVEAREHERFMKELQGGIENISPVVENFRVEHPSETALDDYKFDEVIYNSGTIEELTEKMKLFLIKYNIDFNL